MNKAMLTVGIILLSIIALVMINFAANFSTGSELDYYLLKETTEAAMMDGIDVAYARTGNGTGGMLRMDKERFMESFLCRFADSIDNTREYKVGFYDMSEVPPKVSVKIDSETAVAVQGERGNISTSISAILVNTYHNDQYMQQKLGNEGEG